MERYHEEMSCLSHLQTNDLSEYPLLPWQIAVITILNTSPAWITTALPNPLVPKYSLVVAEGDAQNGALVILVSERCESSPSTPDIEKTIVRLEVQLLTNNSELVILEFFESLGAIEIFDDARCVHHARTKEKFVEIITTCTQGEKPGGKVKNHIRPGIKAKTHDRIGC